ncbi:MAG: hypothetical protein HF962_08430 [Sulfurovum sp.]|nr:hypothetical protein [Sulfurovum sp.]
MKTITLLSTLLVGSVLHANVSNIEPAFVCNKVKCIYDNDEPGELISSIPLLKGWGVGYASFDAVDNNTIGEYSIPTLAFFHSKTKELIILNPIPKNIGSTDKCLDIVGTKESICIKNSKDKKLSQNIKQMTEEIKMWREDIHKAYRTSIDNLDKNGLKQYSGSYFGIRFPKSFTAYPSMKKKGISMGAVTDEATFISSKKDVEFFVYAPLWGGEPKNYTKILDNEKILEDKIEKHDKPKKHRKHTMTHRVVLQDKQERYYRAYTHRRSCIDKKLTQECADLVFGIKYKDKKSYNRYMSDYKQFRSSLQQSAD